MVREHERDERPFDPEKRGSWRGSSKDLVANPSGFRTDLRELVELYYPNLDTDLTADEIIVKIAQADNILETANELLDGHGVEALGPVNASDGPPYEYVNFGDTYDPTIMYSRDDDKTFVAMGGWGDVWSEEGEPSAMQEAWDGHVRREFREKMEDEFEGSGDEASAERFAELDEEGERELFDRAVTRAGNGVRNLRRYPEWVQESDGYTFINMAPVVTEAAHMLSEGWRPGQFEGHAKNPLAVRRNGGVSVAAMDELGPAPLRPGRAAYVRDHIRAYKNGKLSRDAMLMLEQQVIGWGDIATSSERREYYALADEVRKAAGHSRNGSEPPLGAYDNFIRMLDARFSGTTRSRQVRYVNARTALFVKLINLPEGVGSAGGGAEAENNKMSFSVTGLGTDKVRVEMMTSALPRDYRLRAKQGTPERIASYLADFINQVTASVAPRFTHTKF